MDEILKLAGMLGRAIGTSPQFTALRECELKARADKNIQEVTAAYEAQLRKIAQLEQEQAPIEPEEKKNLLDLRERVHAMPYLQELLRVQADYTELMDKVNRQIGAELQIEDGEESG